MGWIIEVIITAAVAVVITSSIFIITLYTRPPMENINATSSLKLRLYFPSGAAVEGHVWSLYMRLL